jgi:pimeloyl-ACP methyl ester carboxylesterase
VARAAVILALSLTACLADKLLLWPPKPVHAEGLEQRMVGGVEVVIAHPADEPRGFVLRFYGNGQLAQDLAYEDFGDLPVEVWAVNYHGYGASSGPATLHGVARAAREAYAALAVRAAGKPIVVVGSSMGAVAALHVAAHERVAGVVLHNPPPLEQLVIERHGWWNLWLLAIPVALQLPDEIDSVRNARLATAPALFVSSAKDGVVPFSYQERVMNAYRGDWEVVVVPGAGHNDPLPAWVAQKLHATIATWIGS